jgi:acetyl esterase/lipase
MPLPPLLRVVALGILTAGLLRAEPLVVPLWSAGAPGSAARMAEPEKIVGTNVSNIHHPSLTVYLPARENANGCAVIVAPGGGHSRLAIQHEGHAVAQWLADRGVAAFVLKYRLSRDDATPAGAPQAYTIDRDELGDAQRAIRLVRSRATEWGVDPSRVGIIGFSAGGEVTILAGTRGTHGQADAADPLDRLSSRPDFFGPIYPGGLQRTDIMLHKELPPVFLLCGANDRPTISELLPEFYVKCKKAGMDAELHIYAGAGHGFGVRESNKTPAGAWLSRFHDWLGDRKFLATASR